MDNLNVVKVIGLKLGVNEKTGRPSNTLCYEEDWSDYEKNNGAEGRKCQSRWCNIDLSGVKVGDTIELLFTPGFQDKLQLSGYRMVKMGTKA